MKVVIIGTGFGNRVMAPVYGRAGFEVEVISPRDGERLSRVCAAGADLVSIHSPPFMHRDHVMVALDHNIAVLCDKPFGRNAAEASEMRNRARELGVLNFVNFEFRRFPVRVKMRELIRSGAIGTPQHINWELFTNGLRTRKYGWLFDNSRGGGWIGAYGSHCIDTLRWLFDSEVTRCGGTVRTDITARIGDDGAVHDATAEDAFSAWCSMTNGISVLIDTACATSVAMPQRVQVLGSEGAIELIGDQKLVLRKPGEEDQKFTLPPPEGDGHEPGLGPWISDVRNALQSQSQISPSFDDGLATAKIMDQIRADAFRTDR
ncbi:Gfo/Idh/MocA family oxidoreductase [Novosphingobium sp. G106]|uniref:Gfo/Idh/MocA family protein n=1 Tax=Novosphingobium sp. G106 TaxID=2849500 RepID=UPI001C2D1B1C|nr:Gfo/Idh/MocA family oxidoreductase [Novosphingobium sp. G106]MBV1686456.1 Gfo/Idh/MocA family oxidoreductase [Novosphingobium sp. G106]